MLFACRQRQNKTTPALLVVSFADQTARNLSRIFVASSEQSDIRATERKRYSKRLSFSDDNVSTASAGRTQKPEGHRFSDCDNQGISAGWEDSYDSSLDCQWLDITGVPAGDYILRVTVNPDSLFPETIITDNSSDVEVRIQ